jgi:FkbM family methyltransferase
MYSQGNEENLILSYFKSFKGSVLDIGANDGRTLSNSLKVIELGWSGVMVEPSKEAFFKLKELHRDNKNITCLNYAIAEIEGELEFHESGTHLNKGDSSLLSSLKMSETIKWRSSTQFHKTTVKAIPFNKLLKLSPIKNFDLITIDVEGMDFEILTQIDLKKVGCKMLIVETNSIENQKFIDYCAKYGMKLFAKNYMNLIFVI